MEIKAIAGNIAAWSGDAIILNICEEQESPAELSNIDKALDGLISQLRQRGEISGKYKEITTIYTMGKLPSQKLVVVGLGKKSEINAEKIRVVVAEVCKMLIQQRKGGTITLAYSPGKLNIGAAAMGQAISEGAILGTYSFKKHLTNTVDKGEIKSLFIIKPDNVKLEDLKQGCRVGEIYGSASNMVRDMVNEPANHMTPVIMAETAERMAKKYHLKIQIMERAEMQQLGMGGLLGVAQGSQQPPKFIVLKYTGKASDKIEIALIGKGITFDSGGISIKPSENLGDMKGDMAGGASVMGAIAAVAQLQIKINVMAIIPATENLPSGTAMKPGDIIKMMNEKTVEIISTDAEGRLILADALSYARKCGAKRLLDVATLTGACRVALGDICTGALGNNQELINQLINAGEEAGECIWQMPMNEEYQELNKSTVADIKNTGGRYAGAITAAWFLREFVDSVPWVHLDIAGTSMIEKERGYLSKGATGVPVRTLINLLVNLAEK